MRRSPLAAAPLPVVLAVWLAGGLAACTDRGAAAPDAAVEPGPDAGPRACPAPDAPFTWPVERAPVAISPSEAWAPRVGPEHPFVTSLGSFDGVPPAIAWVKLSVPLADPERVYYQDSRALPFHFEFVTEHLDPYRGLERDGLDAITLHATGQELVLGAVLFPTRPGVAEYGIQLVGLDAYHPALVVELFASIAATVDAPGRRAVYVPTAEQAACAEANAGWLAERGVPLGSVDAWLDGDQCYASGWAVGRVVALAADEVDDAALSGALLPTDVLLLADPAPAELPPVAGVIGLAPSTPNSHTAILARSFGIPFAYLRTAESAARAGALVGRTIALGAGAHPNGGGCRVRMLDLDAVDPALVAELAALARPPALEVPPKTSRGAFAVDVDLVGPADLPTVGGKAAHYGLLRDVVADASEPAVALTFDLWDAFMAQEIEGGGTLAAAIEARLARHAWPPAMAELDADLAAVRALIEDGTTFSPASRAAVEEALARFAPTRRLRFRSSTNVEDGATFTGAGLYDSATGCPADDLDGDEVGPSACNPATADERGVLRALRKVYASFYRRNAFLERLRRGVDEDEVGMAVLVHHSTPDDLELANGVAVLTRWYSDRIDLVSQLGAESVTNPDGDARPEVVRVERYELDAYPAVLEGSSRVPLGGTVMSWDADYLALTELMVAVTDRYEAVATPGERFALDFELKKVVDHGLRLKQVRPLPLPDLAPGVEPLLVDAPATLCVFEGEQADVFALHRLKSRWSTRSRDVWLRPGALATTLLRHLELAFVDGGVVRELAGAPADLPGFAHAVDGDATIDRWSIGTGQPRQLALRLVPPPPRTRSELPAVTLDEGYFMIEAEYAAPVPYLDADGEVRTRTSEAAMLSSICPVDHAPRPTDQRVERTMGDEVAVATAFYWPPSPTGVIGGYTAPLIGWDRTTITGLTREPIVLESAWSQTYRPAHHNFGGEYLFEPRLEPGLAPSILAELATADVAAIYASESGDVRLVGLDGAIRTP